MTLCLLCPNNSDEFFGDMACHAGERTWMRDGVKQSYYKLCMSESKKVVR